MFGIGFPELLLIMAIALIVVGLYGCDPPESEVRLARSIITMSQNLAPRAK